MNIDSSSGSGSQGDMPMRVRTRTAEGLSGFDNGAVCLPGIHENGETLAIR